MNIVDVAFNTTTGGRVANPVAGVPYYMAAAWGPGAAAAIATALSIAGATIDTTFTGTQGMEITNVVLGGLAGIFAGWHPDNVPVWLSGAEAAVGLWKVTLPAAGPYTVSLSGVGTANVTCVNPPAAPTLPTITMLRYRPLAVQGSALVRIDWSGVYPNGGIPIGASQLGLDTPYWGTVLDTAAYRFSWHDGVLQVFNSAGEVSGNITFSTQGLFHGAGA